MWVLELRTGSYESLAGSIAGVFVEVLDEASSKVLGFLGPLSFLSVSVARVEDVGVNAFELSGDFEVKDGELLGGSAEDVAVEDSIDDAAGVLDRDALAGAVPAGVDQISLGAALLHALYQLLGILGGVQLEECLAEAC